jgi:hypothetical protein
VRSNRLSQSPSARSYPQPRPAGNDRIGLKALDDHQLLPARGTGHEANGPPGDPELVGDQLEQRLVRGAGHGGRCDMGAEDTVDDALDMV